MRLVRAYLSGLPIALSWQVTYACNFRCRGCSYWQDEVNFSAEARAREASLDDIRQAANKLGELGSLIVSIGGGEPFLRRDLAEIVGAIAQQHIPLLTTNGWLIDEQRAREVWDAGLWGISVSLDFSDEHAHDEHRGKPGAAQRARRALQILSRTRTRPHQRVNVMCVLNDRNLGQLEGLVRFAAGNDSYFMMQPYTAIKNGNRRLLPAYKATPHLLALKKRYRNFLSNPYYLGAFDRFYEQGGIQDCKAGRAFFNVDNFLNVQKCVEFRAEHVGNLRDLSAREIVRRLRSESRRNQCRACWYNCRGEVEVLYSVKGLLAALPTLVRGGA
ncbi:MAG: radical SAM protein [Terriglobales bacterium]